jgi:hypothetical protein
VCGTLTGAGLARGWHHSRAHRFFSTSRWNPRLVGLLLAELIVTRLLAADAPITVAIDDTLFHRRGKKVHAAGWFHDGSATGKVTLGFGNNGRWRCRSWPRWHSRVVPRHRIWPVTCST